MTYTLIELFSFSGVFASVIGLVRLSKIDQAYLPFLVLLWCGLANETINFFIIRAGQSNAINANVYVLIEILIVMWLFANWGVFEKRKYLLVLFPIIFSSIWLAENFIFFSIYRFSSYFILTSAFSIVIMSIHMINKLILDEKQNLVRNSKFLICIGFIIFFTYSILVEIFWVYGLNASDDFRVKVYRILSYINLSVNLIYALAVLWIPRKREYSLL